MEFAPRTLIRRPIAQDRAAALRRLAFLGLSLAAAPLFAADVVSTWNTGPGDWGVAANWTNVPAIGGFPDNGNAGVATYDAVLSNSAFVTLDQDIVIERFTLSSGNVGGDFDLTLNSNLAWTGGVLEGAGTTSVAGAASTISGSGTKGLDRILENSGTITFSTSDNTTPFYFGLNGGANAGVLRNTGTFRVTAGGDFSSNFVNASHAIENAGTWTVSGAATTSSITGIAFNNTATVNVMSGTFTLGSGGTSTGAFATSTGASLQFTGGTYLLDQGATFTGTGLPSINGGIVTAGDDAADAITATTFALTNGTLNGLGAFNVTNLAWTSGTMTGSGVTNTSGATSTISGSGTKGLDRALTNSGTMTFSTADNTTPFYFGLNSGANPGVFTNTGAFRVTAGGDFSSNFANADHAINNAGTWTVSGAATTSTVSGLAFNNTATVNVTSGTFALGGSGVSTGSFNISAGAALQFTGGAHVLENGATFTGTGSAGITGGEVMIGDDAADVVTASGFFVNGGLLDGAGAFNVTNLAWTTGTMAGSGVTNTSGTTSTISGTGTKGLDRTLTNSGTMTFSTADNTTPFYFGLNSGDSPGVLNNAGTFRVTAGGDLSANFANASHAINNSGTWIVSGAGTTSFVGGVPFNNTGAVQVNSGTLELLGGGASTGSFAIAAGATLDFNDGYLLNNGTAFTGAGLPRVVNGTVTAGDDAADVITAVTFGLSGGTLAGSGTMNIGDLLWTGGTMAGTGATNTSGTASVISESSNHGLDRALTNSGTMTFTTSDNVGPLYFGLVGSATPGVLTNTGTFNVTAGGDFAPNFSNAGHFISNAGTWNVSGAGTVSSVNAVPFNNSGTVNVTSGTFALAGTDGGSTTGDFAISAGALLRFESDFDFASTASFTGAGVVDLANGTATFDAPFTSTAADLRLTGGELAGTSTLTSNGLLTWLAGTMKGSGATHANGGLELSGSFLVLDERTLRNAASQTATMSGTGSTFYFTNDAIFENAGTFLAQNDTGFYTLSGQSAFQNSGTFTRQTGTETFTVSTAVNFENSGQVNVETGVLELRGGGSTAGDFTVSAGAALRLQSDFTFASTASFGGAGTIELVSGNATFDSTFASAVANLRFTGGMLTGTGTLNSAGFLTWTAGTMSGSGTTNANGGLELNGGFLLINQRTLRNATGQTATLTGLNTSLIFTNAADFQNDGTFLAQNDSSIFDFGTGGIFRNAGTFTRNTETGTFAMQSGIAFANTGQVLVETGTLAFFGGDEGATTGDFTVSEDAVLQIASDFTFALGSSFDGGGSVNFTAGTSRLQGEDYAVGEINVTGGILHIDSSVVLNELNIGDSALVLLTASVPGPKLGAQAVPEPGAFGLCVWGILALVKRKRARAG